MASHDAFEQIIITLAAGDPAKKRQYESGFTHTEIITAWKGKLVSSE